MQGGKCHGSRIARVKERGMLRSIISYRADRSDLAYCGLLCKACISLPNYDDAVARGWMHRVPDSTTFALILLLLRIAVKSLEILIFLFFFSRLKAWLTCMSTHFLKLGFQKLFFSFLCYYVSKKFCKI